MKTTSVSNFQFSARGKLIASFAFAIFAIAASADDWPMFGRANTRNPVSPEKNPPIDWDIKTGRNIKWKAQLGSTAFADPVIAGGLVWIGTNNEHPRDRNLTNEAAVLLCFRESDGKFLYQNAALPLKGPLYRTAVIGWSSSPLIEGGRLWMTTPRGETLCLDIGGLLRGEHEPKEIWTADLIQQFGVYPRMPFMSDGKTCSIAAAYRDRIYVITGNGVARDFTSNPARLHMPAPDAPSLICFDKHSGQIVWTDKSPGTNVLFGQWASPLVVEINGRGQVIVPQGDGWVRSFSALRGELLWKFDINSKSAKWPQSRNVFLNAPVFYENRIYIGGGQDMESGEGPGRLCCIDPNKTGDISVELDDDLCKGKPNPNAGAIWHFDGFNRTRTLVAVRDGLVIAVDFSGFVYCLDARTGRMYWKHDARAHVFGSPLIVDGKVYVGTEDGDVWIFELSKEKKVIAQHSMDDGVYASPIFANGVLYIPTRETLFAIQQGALEKPRPNSRKVAIAAGILETPGEVLDSRPPRIGTNRAPDALYVPTPENVVQKMLELAEVTAEDVIYDLGSGDGRIVIAAAKKYCSKAVGYEIDRRLVEQSRANVAKNQVESLVQIEHKDIFTVDLRDANVIAVYLPSPLLERLKPQFEKLKPGSRIVSHQFEILGFTPDKVITLPSNEDGDQHRLFLWTAPLRKAR